MLKPKLSIVAMALIQANFSVASSTDYTYQTRGTGQFLAGDNQQFGSFADVMVPFVQDLNRIFFVDGSLMLGQNQRGTYSAGIGYRGIHNTKWGEGIFGAFVFSDYYHSALQNTFWQANPGIEWLTKDYEARLQGYIPLSDKRQSYQNTLASNVPSYITKDSGVHRNLNFAMGHRIVDTPVALVEDFGPGVELEVGKHFDYVNGMWLRVGGYHFNYKYPSKSINGIQANVEFNVNPNVSLILQDNYDNQNDNRFSVGLRVRLGGGDAPRNTIQSRMMDPIIRHQARQSYGEALPTRDNYVANGPQFNAFDNVWFFSPGGTNPKSIQTMTAQQGTIDLSSCTAENPCGTLDTFTAEGIAATAPNANLFFEKGSYTIPTNPINGQRWVNMVDGQKIYGRQKGWLQPALAGQRPEINGALFWGDFTAGRFGNGFVTDMKLVGPGQLVPGNTLGYFDLEVFGLNEAAVSLGAVGEIQLHNTSIVAESDRMEFDTLGVFSTLGDVKVRNSSVKIQSKGETYGIYAQNALNQGASLSITHSDISNTGEMAAFSVLSNGDIHIDNSQIYNLVSNPNTSGGSAVRAIYGTGLPVPPFPFPLIGESANIDISNSKITSESIGEGGPVRGISSEGLFAAAGNGSIFNISNSLIRVNSVINTPSNGSNLNSFVVGIQNQSTSNSNIGQQVNVINSSIEVSSDSSALPPDPARNPDGVVGITAINGSIKVENSNLNISAIGVSQNPNSSAFGINQNYNSLILSNSKINVLALDFPQVEAVAPGVTVTTNNSKCTVNGELVDCN